MTNKIQAYIYLGSMQMACYCVIYSITKNIWKLFLSEGLTFIDHLDYNKEILQLKWKTALLRKTASSRCYFLQWSLMKMKFKLSQNNFSEYLVWNFFCQVIRIVFPMTWSVHYVKNFSPEKSISSLIFCKILLMQDCQLTCILDAFHTKRNLSAI